MLIQNSINQLIEWNERIVVFIQSSYKNGADQTILDYINFIKSSGSDSALSLAFANVLQFCSDPDLEGQFENADIERLFDSFFALSQYNLFIDAAKFSYERLGNPIKAKQIVEQRISELEMELAGLRQLANDIS